MVTVLVVVVVVVITFVPLGFIVFVVVVIVVVEGMATFCSIRGLGLITDFVNAFAKHVLVPITAIATKLNIYFLIIVFF